LSSIKDNSSTEHLSTAVRQHHTSRVGAQHTLTPPHQYTLLCNATNIRFAGTNCLHQQATTQGEHKLSDFINNLDTIMTSLEFYQ